MEDTSINSKKNENPFIGENRQAMWEKLKGSPKKHVSKNELLERSQEAKSKVKK